MRGVNYENNNKFTITSPSLDCLGFYQFSVKYYLGVSNDNITLASH